MSGQKSKNSEKAELVKSISSIPPRFMFTKYASWCGNIMFQFFSTYLLTGQENYFNINQFRGLFLELSWWYFSSVFTKTFFVQFSLV